MVTFVHRKHYRIIYIIFFSFFLNNCQLNEPKRSHGLNFLENREKILKVGKTNKNDIIKLMGSPHTKSVSDEDVWIYFERTTTSGKYVKLGKSVLKTNNVLKLAFNKYGILIEKKLYNKKDMKKVKYSKKETENIVKQKSFTGKVLQSVKQKMYSGNKKNRK